MAISQGLPVENDGDAETVAQVLAGDAAAYAVLVGRYRVQFARYATRMLGNREDAEEALQDAFLRAYRSLAKCEDPARFGSWLFRILANRCRTAGTRRGRRERTFVRDEVALLDASEEHPEDRDAWREEIQRALLSLEEDQREAFLLKHVEELGYEEIAELTGVGVSALKMRVKRACERLRVLLHEVQG
ncbi:MAG: RNA polymerase sigma factor [Gemmatimonadetes bacterium]|nr:RNA polymerase sigma factor [Gemmatimonadota bacterium]MCC6771405.1 RNA polymerase sigma factor [Gemmatimonadaceae bacterium]